MDAGTYDFDVNVAGAGPPTAPLTLAGQDLADDKFTVTAIGTLADDDFDLTAVILDDSSEGLAVVSIPCYSATAAVGNVKVWNLTNPDEPGVLLEDYAYGENAVVELPFGAYMGFDVQPADGTPELVFSLPKSPSMMLSISML